MRRYTGSRQSVQPYAAGDLKAVRGAFVAKNTSLAAWCREHGIDRSWASRALADVEQCPAAKRLKSRIMAAAGLAQ